MKIPTKQATRRLAASLAIIAAFATTGAWADTNQKFLFVGQSSGTSDWTDGSSWMYSNGNSGSGGNWKPTAGKPDDFNYDVYFRSPMSAKNGNEYSYNVDWDRVVTFTGAQCVGKTSRYPVHVDTGSTQENPIVFVATQDSYGLTCSQLYLGCSADGYLELRKGTYETTGSMLGSGDGVYSGHLILDGETGKMTFRCGANDANAFLLYNGKLTARSSDVECNGYMSIAKAVGATGIVEKTDGDWSIVAGTQNNGRLYVGHAADTHAEFYHRGGTLGASSYIVVGAFGSSSTGKGYAYFEIDGGAVSNRSNNVIIGDTGNKSGDVAIMNVKSGTIATAKDFYVGNDISGTLDLNGGTVVVPTGNWTYLGGSSSCEGTINLNGGKLITKHIQKNSGTATVNFNGGTLQANAGYTSHSGLIQSGVTVNVNAGGGVIDNGGNAVEIAVALGGTGGLIFSGNNTTTLKGAVNYTGATAVTPGTILAVENETAKNKILANGLVVVGVPTEEGQSVLTYTSALTDADLDKVSCPLAPTTTFVFSDDGKTNIVVGTIGPTLDNYWTGAANDGDLSNAANWKSEVPTTGTANIFCTTNSTLTKGAMFVPTSITFLGGSAAVTINGEFSGITQIANNSPSMVEFKDAVVFSGNVDVVQNSGAVKFTGGVTGLKLERATDIHGTYNFTTTGDSDGDLVEIPNTTVKSDGVYNLPNATFFKHNADFHVDAGGKVVVKNAKIDHNQSKKLLGTFDGLFVVTNQFFVSGNNAHYMCDSGNGTFVVNELSAGKIVPAAKTIMGPDGIICRDNGYVRVYNSGSHEFGSYADWTMYHKEKGTNTSTDKPVFYKASSSSTWSLLTFDTTDYYENTIGRTITCEAPIGAADAASAAKFAVTIKGKGTFVFANTSDANIFSGGLTVQDTATIEVKANAKPGNGAITLGNGTTLALTSTSNAFTTLANTLNLPTEGAATIRIDGARLRSGDNIIIAPVASGATANVTLDEKSTAIAGRDASLKVEDGKLILSIESDGLMIIFR